jgi:hypothetical protein
MSRSAVVTKRETGLGEGPVALGTVPEGWLFVMVVQPGGFLSPSHCRIVLCDIHMPASLPTSGRRLSGCSYQNVW